MGMTSRFTSDDQDTRSRARRRALRAAKVASICLALAGGSSLVGCGDDTDPAPPIIPDAMADATVDDASMDAAPDAEMDATAPDATADAELDATADAEADAMPDAVADAMPDGPVAVPGPFVPPAMRA